MSWDNWRNVDFATLTVSSAAVALSAASPAIGHGTKRAVISVEDADVRWRADGTAPTGSVGHLLTNGSYLLFNNPNSNYQSILNSIQFIRDASTDAKLFISYLGD